MGNGGEALEAGKGYDTEKGMYPFHNENKVHGTVIFSYIFKHHEQTSDLCQPPPRGGLVEQGVCQSSMGRNP